MAIIQEDIKQFYLSKHPEEESFLIPFLAGFDVTWASRQRANNSTFSVFFLNPENFIKESYGFNFEIMLIYTPYDTLEPRTIQSAEQFLREHPAKGRVESLVFFLISNDKNANEWVNNYLSSRQESRIIVTFPKQELEQNKGNSWYIRNKLNDQFYGRDLFAYTLPLTEDTYFFGRQPIIASSIDAIKRSENRGIFGLRKTGKTSLLFKIQRLIKQEAIGEVFFYDCKTPSLRKLKWNELLEKICKDISQRLQISIKIKNTNEIEIVNIFNELIESLSQKNTKIILIFDEIEYISFKSIQDKHWHEEFLDFWQTMWSCQTLYKNLVFIIAGVNPSVVEIDTINGVQNPLFGIVPAEYLRGFDYDETKNLLKTLGKRMGLNFTPDGIDYIYNQYGGHPLLTRLAGSWINKYVQLDKKDKPWEINTELLQKTQENRDSDLVFYCKHIISELKDFYIAEYEMLELLASGQTHDFVEFSIFPEYIKHLSNYGLLKYATNKKPIISIPVVERYVGIELAKKEGRTSIYKLIEQGRRNEWLEIRKDRIIKDIKLLENIIKQNKKDLLFGANSFPEGEELISLKVVSNKKEFQYFINTLNRCFVESIENYGKSIKKPKYLGEDIKINYSAMYDILRRIKIYRHDADHLELTKMVNQELSDYLKHDLEGKKPSEVKELYFWLQQKIIDEFLASINTEINNLS